MLRAFAAVLFTLSLLPIAGCPSIGAPAATEGVTAGGPCSADFECASGLTCECGACTAPSDDDRPPRCIQLDDSCNDPPSACYVACGDETVAGPADCIGGREACSTTGGVLRSQCPEETCWGEPLTGEICLEGEWVCEFGRSPLGGCYTFDCAAADATGCVAACGGPLPTGQDCVGGEWVCESGMPVEECGECVGMPPSCLRSCDDTSPLGAATCDMSALEWSCSHIVLPDAGTPVTADECCAPATVIRNVADVTAAQDITCVVGALSVLTGTATDVTLPLLDRVTKLQVGSSTLGRLSLPALTTIDEELFVESNPLLTELSAPQLTSVGSFYVSDNPQLPECEVEDLLAQITANVVVSLIVIDNNLVCEGDAGPDPDAGPGPDAGFLPPDAGPVDAGAYDAGPDDDAGGMPDDAG